ncbi:MAG: hypothetical protein CHACPFDD_00417 [Phycisphaerae bacterium]|nr:hypothetical protein [Phycisphaerae bacterium]
MASRRIIVDPPHPAAMTPEQRRAELATILAAGVISRFQQRHFIAIDGGDANPTQRNATDSGERRLEVLRGASPDPRLIGLLPRLVQFRQRRSGRQRPTMPGSQSFRE